MRSPEPVPAPAPADVPVFILCGGQGTRLGAGAETAPKPMVEIGGKPMLLHVMGWYGRFGFRRFVLCTGHRGEVIADYFLNYAARNADFTVELGRRDGITYHQRERAPGWEVTVAHTGERAMTGARIARAAARYLGEAEHFAATYADGLTDADLGEELAHHLAHERLGTVLTANPPSTFGRFELSEDGVASFVEKPSRTSEWINGGFFVFRRGFLDYLSAEEGCVLEGEPLQRLTRDGQLSYYRHGGFWRCVDTVRDRDEVRGLWEAGAAPWRA